MEHTSVYVCNVEATNDFYSRATEMTHDLENFVRPRCIGVTPDLDSAAKLLGSALKMEAEFLDMVDIEIHDVEETLDDQSKILTVQATAKGLDGNDIYGEPYELKLMGIAVPIPVFQ